MLEPSAKSGEAAEFYADAFQRFQSSGNYFVRMLGKVFFNNTKSFMTGILTVVRLRDIVCYFDFNISTILIFIYVLNISATNLLSHHILGTCFRGPA